MRDSRRPRTRAFALGAIAVLVLAAFPMRAAGAGEGSLPTPKDVVFLFTEECSRPANVASEQALRQVMDADRSLQIEYHYEFLDLRRYPGETYSSHITSFLREKYRLRPPDLVIPIGPGSLGYAVKYGQNIFPGVPVVYCNVLSTEARSLPPGAPAAGSVMQFESLRTLDAALRLWPRTTKVLVVSGASDLDHALRLVAARGWESLAGRAAVEEWEGLPMDELAEKLKALPAGTLVFYTAIFEDGSGRIWPPSEALDVVAAASAVPVLGCTSTYMDHGLTGGFLFDVSGGGTRAGEAALKVLHGEDPSLLRVSSEGLVAPAFDARALKRFGVSRGLLPPGSEVLFSEPPVWRKNPWLAVGVVSFALFETLLIVVLVFELRRRRQAERRALEEGRRLALATEVAKLGIWEWLADGDRLVASPEVLAMHGMQDLAHPLLGDGEQFVHPEDRARLARGRESAQCRPGQFNVEYRVVSRKGETRWLSVTAASFAGPSGKVERLVGATQDITERKVAVEALREKDARISLAAAAAKIGFWDWNVETNQMWASPEARALYGYAEDAEIRIDTVDAFEHPDDLERDREVRARALSQPGNHCVEYRLLLPGEKIRWLSVLATAFADPSGKVVRLLGVTQDITERKEGEERLRASEERYRAFLKYSTEGVCRYETSEPIPVTLPEEEQVERIFRRAYLAECNDAFSAMFGRSSEEMVGMPLEEILPPSDPRNVEYLRKFIQAGYRQLGDESYKVDREGNERCTSSSGAGILQNGCLVRVWSIQRDITEQKAAEAALRKSEERFRRLFEAAVDGIAVADAETGILVECNGALQAMVGRTREELIGQPQAVLHPPQPLVDGVTPSFARRRDGPAEVLLENKLAHKDGRVFDVEIKAALFDLGGRPRLLGIFRDITERKRAAAALGESRAQLISLVESTRDLIWSVDTTRFGLLTFNRALRDYFLETRGFEIREGMPPDELLPPDFARQWVEFYDRALREGPFTVEYKTSGGNRTLSLSFNLVKRGEEVIGISVFGGDITKQRGAEQEAQELRWELAHLARVATMGELTAALAHELNQPLTAIRSNAQAGQQLLAQGKLSLEETEEIFSDIVADDQRASEIIRRLRAMLKKGRSESQPLDLNDLIQEMGQLVRPEVVLRDVWLTLDLEPDLPQTRGDRIQLEQVLLNLLTNAMDAVARQPTRWVAVRTWAHGDGEVRVSVGDSGTGIPEESFERIFEPFVTTKENGMGMGLAVCRSIVAAHGGRVWAGNNEGGGATFTLALPAHGEEE